MIFIYFYIVIRILFSKINFENKIIINNRMLQFTAASIKQDVYLSLMKLQIQIDQIKLKNQIKKPN